MQDYGLALWSCIGFYKKTIKSQSILIPKNIKTKKTAGQETKNNTSTKQPENIKMAIVSPYLSMVIFNINGLNSIINR